VRGSILWLVVGGPLGTPWAICIGAIAGVLIQRAMIFWLTGWRPPLLRLVLASLPALALALALMLSRRVHWSADGAVAAGLIVQSLLLHYLGSVPPLGEA
jgi:hypothetical protein